MAATKKNSKPRKRAKPVGDRRKFEHLLKNAHTLQRYHLRLYVTGSSLRSSQAIANISSLCDEYLPGRYDLEVIDIYQQPAQAVEQQIIAAPTLIKELPPPPKRLVGNLSDRAKVLVSLSLTGKISPTKWVEV